MLARAFPRGWFHQIAASLACALIPFFATTGFSQEATVTTDNYTTRSNIVYREGDDPFIQQQCRLDLVYPANTTGFATLVWFHGGGLTGGNRAIPEALKQRGFAVVSASYRLSPDVKSPTYVQDAAAAVAWVLNNIESYGGSKRLVIVSGHSAGGYLAAMVGLDKQYLAAHDIDADDLAGLAPLSGQMITHSTIRGEQGIPATQPIIDSMAPAYHIRNDTPPILLVTGDRELDEGGRYEENAYLHRMLKVINHPHVTLHELEGFDHNGMVAPACELVANFVGSIKE